METVFSGYMYLHIEKWIFTLFDLMYEVHYSVSLQAHICSVSSLLTTTL